MGIEQGKNFQPESRKKIENLVYYFREKKEQDPEYFQSSVEAVKSYAAGATVSKVDSSFYPNWTPEDFQKLLEVLKQDNLIEE